MLSFFLIISLFIVLTILGPTACGKTSLAVQLAHRLNAEIISGDSRQVYCDMDLGTGKDLYEYTVNGFPVPYHLINIVPAGSKYTVFQFQQDFLHAYNGVVGRGKEVVFCGGSGLYMESVLRSYQMSPVPVNPALRSRLQEHSLAELEDMLASMKVMHNKTDVDTKERAIRAIEIEEYNKHCPTEKRTFPQVQSLIIGLDVPREVRRQRITQRLVSRLKDGMIDEVKHLLQKGILPEDLMYYGLEYKYLTLHVIGQLTYEQMFSQLEIAIHQVAKRQMTWFRGMERRGLKIHWVDGMLPMQAMVDTIMSLKKQEELLSGQNL